MPTKRDILILASLFAICLLLFFATILAHFVLDELALKRHGIKADEHGDEELHKVGAHLLRLGLKACPNIGAASLMGASLMAILLTVNLILFDQSELTALMSTRAFLPVAIITGLLFYRLRGQYRLAYGMIEMSVGVVTMWFSIKTSAHDLLTKSIDLLGGIYIMVRGLDNIDQALPSPHRR